jgi:hypothetical protein
MKAYKNNYVTFVGFDVLTAMVMKSTIFLVVTLCSSDRFRRFEGEYRLLLQG